MCADIRFNFIPFVLLLHLCRRFVRSSSVDAHVTSIQVKSVQAVTKEQVKYILQLNCLRKRRKKVLNFVEKHWGMEMEMQYTERACDRTGFRE